MVRYRPVDVGVGLDVIAYTRKELAALEEGNSFVQQALREGMVLVGSLAGTPTPQPD